MANIKRLYQNGRLVGEYSSTGDDLKDIELCRELLRQKGLYRPTTVAQALFRQAVSFATTTSYLYKRDLTQEPRNLASLSPFVVNGALAVELYLKALAQLHDMSLRGHDLLRLFDALPGLREPSWTRTSQGPLGHVASQSLISSAMLLGRCAVRSSGGATSTKMEAQRRLRLSP